MKTLDVVAISGSTSQPHSRTLTLVNAILYKLELRLPTRRHVIELGTIAGSLGTTLVRTDAPASLEDALRRIEAADLLVIAAPVYRGSYPGMFKHLFDLVDMNALVNTAVLLAATGGSDRHSLVLDHQFRPLFNFFQALTLPVGIYASEADFRDYRIASKFLHKRISQAVEQAALWLGDGRDQALEVPPIESPRTLHPCPEPG